MSYEQIGNLRAADRRAIKAIIGPHDGLWPAGDVIIEPKGDDPTLVEPYGGGPLTSKAYRDTAHKLLTQARGVLGVIDRCSGRTIAVHLVVGNVQRPANYLGVYWDDSVTGLRISAATIYEDIDEHDPRPAGWFTKPRDTVRSFLTEADWDDPTSQVHEVKRLAALHGKA